MLPQPGAMPPTLAAGEVGGVLVDLLIVLATAAGVGMVLRRLKLALIPGYLLAGAIFGPGALGIVDATAITEIADLAIVLLMFTIGLSLSREELRGGLLPIVGVGALSTFATLACVTPVGLVFGLDAPRAVAVAGSMAMSSTAVVLRLLQQRTELGTAHGRIAFGTLLTQDLIVVFLLAGVPLLTSWAGIESDRELSVAGLVSGFLVAVGAVGLMVVVGGFATPRVMAEAAKDRSGELALLLSGAMALGAAVLTGKIGLSPELGAFVAGLLLATTPYRHELQARFGPTRDIFMAIFFTTVGMQLDLAAVGDAWWAIPICLVVIIVIKTATIGLSAWVFGAPAPVAWVAGVTLAQAGEFSLVVFFAARSAGLIDDERVVGVVIAIVVMSLFLTPLLIDSGRRFVGVFRRMPSAPWTLPGTRRVGMVDNEAVRPEDPAVRRTRVVVAGYGPIGRTLADNFARLGADVRIIELNATTVQRQAKTGQATIYGDAGNALVLREAGVPDADAVILTLPDEAATIRAIRAARQLAPGAFIAARAPYLSKAFIAREAGADHVTVEEMATADAMQQQVIAAFEARRNPPED
ncbi:MAG: cation:proton antiporter [Planctomycetota bacterium]